MEKYFILSKMQLKKLTIVDFGSVVAHIKN